jgi:hypothetical protein
MSNYRTLKQTKGEELTRKNGSARKQLLKSHYPLFYLDLENINNRMNEVTMEGKKRGV